MLSSLTPVGENSRSQRWWITVSAFTVGSVLGGTATGVVAGVAGELVATPPLVGLIALSATAAATLVVDRAGVTPPSLERQVDRTWMTRLRGWVYGLGYGVQLGSGLVTYITSWTTWLTVVAMVVVGDLRAAVAMGILFGLVRGISVWTTRKLVSPEAIRSHHRRLIALDRPMRRGADLATLLVVVGAATAAIT